MAKEVIDDLFIGSLHFLALTRKGLAHEAATERTAKQASSINALLDGCYEGDTTIGELLRLGPDRIKQHGASGFEPRQHTSHASRFPPSASSRIN